MKIMILKFVYAESKYQCWQAEKMASSLSYLHISIMAAKLKKNKYKNLWSNMLVMPNWYKAIQKHFPMVGRSLLTYIDAIRIKM